MDVVIDTNIIIQENFLRTGKFLALQDYLDKTQSYVILPQIVREESIFHYKEKVSEQLNKFKELSRTCFSHAVTELNIDVEKEVAAYETYIQKLSNDGLLIEIPYDNYFLHDVVYRMINRKKPCNEKGQECRDAILWLSIKNFLKKEIPVAFISFNFKEFASSDKKDLHPDLRAELDRENLILKYYLDINDFLMNHAAKLDDITKKWVKEKLSKIDLDSLIIDYFIIHDSFLKRLAESTTVINCIDAFPTILFHELEDFYVYEMKNGDIYLNLILEIYMEIESEFEEIGTKTFNSEAHIEISGKIIDKEIKELEIDNVYQGKRAKSYKEKYGGGGKDLIRDKKGRIIECNLIHPDCEGDKCSDCGILKVNYFLP